MTHNFTKVYNIFVSPLQKHELTLDKAGSILMPDEDSSVSNSKSKAVMKGAKFRNVTKDTTKQ